MARSVLALLLIILAVLLVFEITDKKAAAQSTGGMGQVIQNQKLILDKLNAIEKKLNVIKARI